MLRNRHTLALVALLALTPACDGDTIDAGPDSETAENVGQVDEAEEDGGEDDDAGVLLLGCSLEPACDAVDLPSGGDPAGDAGVAPQASYSGDGLCVLAALTAAEPSLVQTVMTFDASVANLDFAIVGPQEALRQSYGVTEGVGEWINPPMLCELQGRDFFENCMVSFNAECLDPEAWVVGCEPVDELVCPAVSDGRP